MNGQIECTTDCIHCVSYYRCTSEMKLDEHTRDFWLGEEAKTDEYEHIRAEREAIDAEIRTEIEDLDEADEYDEENEDSDDEAEQKKYVYLEEKYDISKHGIVTGIRLYYADDRMPMADIKTAFVL